MTCLFELHLMASGATRDDIVQKHCRASKKALEIGMRTRTLVYGLRDGKIVDIAAEARKVGKAHGRAQNEYSQLLQK